MKIRQQQHRRGNILFLTALLMIGMIAMLAFAVDLGYLYVARTQLQRSADAAAIAATWDLIDEARLQQTVDLSAALARAQATAGDYASRNNVGTVSPTLSVDDVTIGYLSDPSDPNSIISTANLNISNAVQVRVRRASGQNGEVPFFFGRVFGMDSMSFEATATAAILTNFGGFQVPPDGSNLNILPFAADEDSFNQLLAGVGDDNWTWDNELEQVVPGPDGILEMNLYPGSDSNLPSGNRGTIDIGSSNNSTADIARQILEGISPDDLAFHGGKLQFDANTGTLDLNGDTGISAGVKDELTSVIGNANIVPLFSTVSGPGNNAQYTITRFVGARVMEVSLTGSMDDKRVIIQPAPVVAKGGIPASNATPQSYFVYSTVWLVR